MDPRVVIGFALAIALVAPTPPLAASATAADEGLVGTVREADGAPAPGVDVWLVRTWEEGATPPVKTDADGRYRLSASVGPYIEAVVSAVSLQLVPTGYAHAIRRIVHQMNVAIPAGGSSTLDVILPDASATGTCGMTGCTIDVAASGFSPGETLEVRLVAGIKVGDRTFSERLATLVAGPDGSARSTYVVDGLVRAGYGIAVVSAPPPAGGSPIKSAETAQTLAVGPPPCTDPACTWRAYVPRLAGSAWLTLPSTGRAIASFTVSSLVPGQEVGGRITAGSGCGPDARVIATFPGYTAGAAGTRTQRIAIGGAGLVRLRAIERDGTKLWFKLSVGKRWSCMRLWRRD